MVRTSVERQEHFQWREWWVYNVCASAVSICCRDWRVIQCVFPREYFVQGICCQCSAWLARHCIVHSMKTFSFTAVWSASHPFSVQFLQCLDCKETKDLGWSNIILSSTLYLFRFGQEIMRFTWTFNDPQMTSVLVKFAWLWRLVLWKSPTV